MKGLKSAKIRTAPKIFGLILKPAALLLSKIVEGRAYSDIYDYCGELYMKRVWLFGKKPTVTGSDSLINARIHRVYKDDMDRALHSHPWWCISIILQNGYWEIMPKNPDGYKDWALANCVNPEMSGIMNLVLKPDAAPYTEEVVRVWRGPGSLVFRPANSRHRLELDNGKTCTSFFITGRKSQAWGFFGEKGFDYWRNYLNEWGDLSSSEGFYKKDKRNG